MVVATDGTQSYAVFTYKCGGLNWTGTNFASIGFSATVCGTKYFFANHPFSRQPNVNDIACFNQTCPPWTNVVYKINSEPEGWKKMLCHSIYDLHALHNYFEVVMIILISLQKFMLHIFATKSEIDMVSQPASSHNCMLYRL